MADDCCYEEHQPSEECIYWLTRDCIAFKVEFAKSQKKLVEEGFDDTVLGTLVVIESILLKPPCIQDVHDIAKHHNDEEEDEEELLHVTHCLLDETEVDRERWEHAQRIDEVNPQHHDSNQRYDRHHFLRGKFPDFDDKKRDIE